MSGYISQVIEENFKQIRHVVSERYWCLNFFITFQGMIFYALSRINDMNLLPIFLLSAFLLLVFVSSALLLITIKVDLEFANFANSVRKALMDYKLQECIVYYPFSTTVKLRAQGKEIPAFPTASRTVEGIYYATLISGLHALLIILVAPLFGKEYYFLFMKMPLITYASLLLPSFFTWLWPVGGTVARYVHKILRRINLQEDATNKGDISDPSLGSPLYVVPSAIGTVSVILAHVIFLSEIPIITTERYIAVTLIFTSLAVSLVIVPILAFVSSKSSKE